MNKNNPHLIYIASDQRSGSTMLDMLLANGKDIVSVGEMKLLGNHIRKEGYGYSWGWKCTCGQSIDDCSLWSKVIHKFKHKRSDVEIETDAKFQIGIKVVIKTILLSYFGALSTYLDKNKKGLNVAANCWTLYDLVGQVTNKAYILDSSKSPEHLYYLAKAANNRTVKVIYIVRDSRGVSNSKLKWKKTTNSSANLSIHKGLWMWFLTNLYIKRVLKLLINVEILRISYEGLCEHPKDEIVAICKFIGIEYDDGMLLMDARNKHNIAGTPNRYSKKNSMIKKDESWREGINKKNNVFQYYLGKTLNYLI